MSKQIKYIGSEHILGEIARDSGFYWLIHPYIEDNRGRVVLDVTRVIAHPKWSTEQITDDLLNNINGG